MPSYATLRASDRIKYKFNSLNHVLPAVKQCLSKIPPSKKIIGLYKITFGVHLFISCYKKWQDYFFIAMKPKNLVNQNSNSELTAEKLRTYKGFENFTDEQAQIAILNIKRLAKLLFGMYINDNPPQPQ